MAKIKVTYFDIPALGEPVRLLLAYGGENFEDNRISMEKWTEMKDKMPFGQLPVYEEDSKVSNQSLAIVRYLAKRYKLNGGDAWEDLELDALGDTIVELLIKVAMYHYENSASVKAKKKEVLDKETLPLYLERLENIAKRNKGHLALRKLTWVDILFTAIVKYMSLMAKIEILETNPNLKAVYQNVMKLPAIKGWYEKYPYNLDATIAWLEATGQPTQE